MLTGPINANCAQEKSPYVLRISTYKMNVQKLLGFCFIFLECDKNRAHSLPLERSWPDKIWQTCVLWVAGEGKLYGFHATSYFRVLGGKLL